MYDIIYADPPWKYKDEKGNDPKLGGITYDVMSLQDIKGMGAWIASVANKNSLLFLWTTMPMLREGLEVIDAWGYTYITCGFNWVKTNPSKEVKYATLMKNDDFPGLGVRRIATTNMIDINKDIYSGLGSYVCGNSELCLIGKRGNGLKRISKSVKQIVFAPRLKHSSKPDEIRKRIELLYGDVKKVELFARERADGWDSLGSELGTYYNPEKKDWEKI